MGGVAAYCLAGTLEGIRLTVKVPEQRYVTRAMGVLVVTFFLVSMFRRLRACSAATSVSPSVGPTSAIVARRLFEKAMGFPVLPAPIDEISLDASSRLKLIRWIGQVWFARLYYAAAH